MMGVFLQMPLNSIVIECPSLSNPANGIVVVTGLTPDSIATYTCNAGYQLFGDATRTCNFNGQWTSAEPFCSRKYMYMYLYMCLVMVQVQIAMFCLCASMTDR